MLFKNVIQLILRWKFCILYRNSIRWSFTVWF